MSKRMYHPCHKLSVPSAKIFWCRHCMQMFEDAISRWKHSKVCRFYNGAKPKDQDGQVIQMYVKPDTVSYSQNFLPGQTVIHKPQIKKKTAELKCVICNAKFFSLYDMREHVKYPCQKAYKDSTDSDSDVQEESVKFKIRRVELDKELAVKSSTALSVLAEASKHVESLSHRLPIKTELVTDGEQRVEKCLQTVPATEQVVEVAPVYASYRQIEHVSADSETLRQVPRLDLEPVIIVIQTDDGQDLPEASLDEESILLYLREIIQTFQVGQVLEIHTKFQAVKTFVVGPGGTIFPAEYPPFRVAGVKQEPSTGNSSSTQAVSQVPTETTDSSVDSSLLLALASEQIHGSVDQSTNTDITDSSSQPQFTSSVEQVGYLVPLSGEEKPDTLSQSVRPEILESTSGTFITKTEHSYQLPYSEQSKSYIDSQPQLGSHPIVQVEVDRLQSRENLNQIDLQNFVTFIQRSVPEGTSCVETTSSIQPTHVASSQTSQTNTTSEVLKQVPVVIGSSFNTEVNKTENILESLVCTYAASTDVYKMAGEQQQLLTSASNWFGFAELTDDYVSSNVLQPGSIGSPSASTSCDKQEVNLQRDENEIVVSILSPKSGIAKYKVLARQKAEDDIPETRKTFSHAGYNWAYQGRNSILKVNSLKTSEITHSVKKVTVHKNEEEKSKGTLKSTKVDTFKVQRNNGGKSKIKNGKPKVIILQTLKGTTAQQKQNCSVKAGTENIQMCSAIKVKESQRKEKCDNFKVDKVNVYEISSDQKQKNNNVLTNTEHRQERHPSDLTEKNVTSQNDTDSEGTFKISEAEVGVMEELKDTVKTNCSSQGETSRYLQEHENKPKTYAEDGSLSENCSVSGEIKKKESNIKEMKSNSDKKENLTESNRREIRSNSDMVENVTEYKNDKSQNGECEFMDIPGSDSVKHEITDVTCVPLVNKCSVTLRRDPSIESFNKDLFDSSDQTVKVNFLKRKSLEQGNNNGNKELSLSRQSSDSGGSICDLPYSAKRLKSSDDKLKVNMVYNADINVRKSGRLQSAKCASRYRGDYGIRADTYNKITSKKSEPSLIDNQSIIDKNEMTRLNFEATDVKGDSVDGLIAMETESVCTDFSEIIPNTNGTLQQVVDHRKHKKLKNEENASDDQNDSCPEKKQMNSGQEVNDQRSVSRSVEDECVPGRNIQRDESQANSHYDIFPDSFHTSEEFEKSIENCCSKCDLSGIVTNNSPVPCPLTSNTNVGNDNENNHKLDALEEKQSTETLETTAIITEGDSLDIKKNKVDSVKTQSASVEKVSTTTGYVHSVGKSVNKKQKYIARRSANTNKDSELFSQVLYPDSSPEKCNPGQVLETLRLRLFEKVGLSAHENDCKPKAFESRLISSKLKQSLSSNCVGETLQIAENEQKNISNSSTNTVINSRTTPPQGSISSSSVTILEEVAKTLDSMQKAKRKNESKVLKPKPKRRKFADKKFMLRSMSRNKENDFDITVHENEKHIKDDMLKGNRKLEQHSVDTCGFASTVCNMNNMNNDGVETNSNNHIDNVNPSNKALIGDESRTDGCVIEITESLVGKKDNVGERLESQNGVKIIRKKPKTVKCHSCFQTFRSKEVMRKHYPCRVRQTRTWSQNKLRPNRAFRSDNLPRKKVVNFESKSNKSSKQNGKQRPQLLTPRKTKFRRVKGKRRRKLHQLIQDLITKRKIVEWPHLDVVFTELSFKEQCMYRLGLFCVGSKLEGLENYSEEDFAIFKEHQDKEKEFFLTRNFKHIFPPSDNESLDSNGDTKPLEPVIQICDSKTVPSFTKDIESSNSLASIHSEEPGLFEILPAGICEAETDGDNCLFETQKSGVLCYEQENMSESSDLNKLHLKDSKQPLISFEVRGLINEILDDMLHRVFLLISNNGSGKARSDMTENDSTEVDISLMEACNIDKGISETVNSTSDILSDNDIYIPETNSSNVSAEVIQDNVYVSEALDVKSGVEASNEEKKCIGGSRPAQHLEEPQTLRDSGESEGYQADVSVVVNTYSSININISETTNSQSSRHDPKSLKELSRAVHSHHVNSLCDSLFSCSELYRGVANSAGDVSQNEFSEKYKKNMNGMTVGNELNLNMVQVNLTDAHLHESENEEESLLSSGNDLIEEIVVGEKDPAYTRMISSLKTDAAESMIENEYLEQQKLSPYTFQISETTVESFMVEESSNINFDSIFKKEDFQLNTPDDRNTESHVHENVLSHGCSIVDCDSKQDKRNDTLEKEGMLLESLSEIHDHLNECEIEDYECTDTHENEVQVGKGREMKEIISEHKLNSNEKCSVRSNILLEGKASVANLEEQNPDSSNIAEQVSPFLYENDFQKKSRNKDSESCSYTKASDVNETIMNLSLPEHRLSQTEMTVLEEKVNSFTCSDLHEDSKITVNISSSEMYISNNESCKGTFQDSENSETILQELYKSKLDENAYDFNDTHDVADTQSDGTVSAIRELSKTFGEKQNLTSLIKPDTASLIKPDTVIRYKINGVCINENVETGVKEIASEEFSETDIHIGSSQESISESSIDGESSCYYSEQGKCSERGEVISDLETTCTVNKNETQKCAEQTALTENRGNKVSYRYDIKDCTHNDSCVTLEPDRSKFKKTKSYESYNSLEKPLSDKENDGDITFVEDQDDEQFAISESHNKTNSEEIEVMRHGDDKCILRKEIAFDCLSQNSSDILSVSLCENVEFDDQSFSSTREDLPGSFRALEKDLDISFISKTETPPVLEKEINGMPEDCQEKTFEYSETILEDSGPPVLEPVRKPRGERHFLDIIGEICEKKVEDEKKDSADVLVMSKEVNDTEAPTSFESETLSEASIIEKEDIGRHFSDVIDSSNIEKPQFNEMHILINKSERGEVTLAKIKSLLKAEPKKGHLIPKEKLLKIRSGVEHIIKKVKVPEKKDPSWLKRDTLLDYSYSNKIVHGCETSLIGIDKSSHPDILSGEDVGEKDYICQNPSDTDPTTGNITDNILQMLTSLEDKGSFADNMTNLLDILAENLGFQRSHSRTNDDTENDNEIKQKTMDSEDDRVRSVKGKSKLELEDSEEEPPSLDDIPIADDFFVNEESSPSGILNTDNEMNDTSLISNSSNRSDQCYLREHTDLGQIDEVLTSKSEKVFKNHRAKEPNVVQIEKKVYDENRTAYEVQEEAHEVLTESKPQSKDTEKAQTIFKSITELNSIETDDDSDSRETFDVAALSQRISELKYLSKDAGESDLDSDIMSDKDSSMEGLKTSIGGRSDYDEDESSNIWRNSLSDEGSNVKDSMEKLLDIDSSEKGSESSHSAKEKLAGRELIETQYSQFRQCSIEVEDVTSCDKQPSNNCNELPYMNKSQFTEADKKERNIITEQNKLVGQKLLQAKNNEEDGENSFHILSEKSYPGSSWPNEANYNIAVAENEFTDETVKPFSVDLEFDKPDRDENHPNIVQPGKIHQQDKFKGSLAESKVSTPFYDSTIKLHTRTILVGEKQESLEENSDHFKNVYETTALTVGEIEISHTEVNERDGLNENYSEENSKQFQSVLQCPNKLTENPDNFNQNSDNLNYKDRPCSPGIQELDINVDTADIVEKETVYFDDSENKEIRIIEEAAVTPEEGNVKFKERSHCLKSEVHFGVFNATPSDMFESKSIKKALDPVKLTTVDYTKDELEFAATKEINKNPKNITNSEHEDLSLIETERFMACTTEDTFQKNNELQHTLKTNQMCTNSSSSRRSYFYEKPNSIAESGTESILQGDERDDHNPRSTQIGLVLEAEKSVEKDYQNNLQADMDILEVKTDLGSSDLNMEIIAGSTEIEGSEMTWLPVYSKEILKIVNCEEKGEEELKVTKENHDISDKTQESVGEELRKKAGRLNLTDLDQTPELTTLSVCSNENVIVHNREEKRGELNTLNCDAADEFQESLGDKFDNQSNEKTGELITEDSDQTHVVTGLHVYPNGNSISDDIEERETKEIMANCNKIDEVHESDDELNEQLDQSHSKLMLKSPSVTETFYVDGESACKENMNYSDFDFTNFTDKKYHRQNNSIAANIYEVGEHAHLSTAGKSAISSEVDLSNDTAKTDLIDNVMEYIDAKVQHRNFDDKPFEISGPQNKTEIKIARISTNDKDDFEENNVHVDHDIFDPVVDCYTNNESNTDDCIDHLMADITITKNLKSSVDSVKDTTSGNPITGHVEQIEHSRAETVAEDATDEGENHGGAINYCNLPSDTCKTDQTELDIENDVQNTSEELKVKDQTKIPSDITEAEIANTFCTVMNMSDKDTGETTDDVEIFPKDHSNNVTDLGREDMYYLAETLDKTGNSRMKEINSTHSTGSEVGIGLQDESVNELTFEDVGQGDRFFNTDYATLEVSAKKRSELMYTSEDSNNTLVYDSYEMVRINNVSESEQATIDEDGSPLKSTESFDLHDFHEEFCETIAEKVKRKQKERLMKLEQARDKYRCLYGETEHPKEKQKQFSIFRSTMLQKKAERARKKELSRKDGDCLTKLKERFASLPKDFIIPPCSVVLKPVDENKIKEKNSVKPCSVHLERLDNRTLDRYRKSTEAFEKRPPIRFKINLTKLCIKPCSPRPAYMSDPVGEDSTEEESEGEFSDESSGNSSLRSTGSKTGPQVSEYKVYEIKNSPRTFHKGLEEGKPIKIKVRSVPPQTYGGHQILQDEGQKLLPSVFDNITDEKISCYYDEVKETSSNEQTKDKFEPKWIKDLQLSESDTTELDSDTDYITTEAVKGNDHSKEDYSEENLTAEVADIDNTDTEATYQNTNPADNDCIKQGDKLTSSYSIQVCIETENKNDCLCSEFDSDPKSDLREKSENVNETETFIIDAKTSISEATGSILNSKNDQTTSKEYDAQTTVTDNEMSKLELESELDVSQEEGDKDSFENLVTDVNHDKFCESTDGPQHSTVVKEHVSVEEQTVNVKDDEIDEDRENIKAVLSLKNDTATERPVSEVALADGSDVIYYAVEVNDDFETDQAISNLDQLDVEQLNLDPEHVTVLSTEEIETSTVESMVVERVEIQESDICENFGEISEVSQILGHEEIVPVNEVEARSSDITEVSSVAVVEQIDKFVYGIDEDTRSPLELVEECVMNCTAEVHLEAEADT